MPRILGVQDGTVAPTDLSTGVLSLIPPSGVWLPFGGDVAPSGWFLCDGAEVSRTTYAALFAALGTKFGVGNGSTTFNLPDMRGRVVAGKDNMGGTPAGRLTTAGAGFVGNTIGAAGGAQTHTLTTAQTESHNHGGGVHSHGVNDPSHVHGPGSGGAPGFLVTTGTTGDAGIDMGGTGSIPYRFATAAAITGISIANSAATIASNGSGQPHQNTQPTLVSNYIIKI